MFLLIKFPFTVFTQIAEAISSVESFENVKKEQFLKSNRNTNKIYEEIKNSLNSVQNILSSPLLLKNIKTEIHLSLGLSYLRKNRD
jgi:hypothetical protein